MTLRRLAALRAGWQPPPCRCPRCPPQPTRPGASSAVAPVDGKFQIIFQADGLPTGVSMDPQTVKVRIAGQDVASTAEPITSGDAVTRIAMLSLDNSQSMAKDGKLASAKAAATTFLQTLPADVEVGLVTFANTAETKQTPTLDKAQVQAAIDAIEISPVSGTALYDGAALAADAGINCGVRQCSAADRRQGGRQQHRHPRGRRLRGEGQRRHDGCRVHRSGRGPADNR